MKWVGVVGTVAIVLTLAAPAGAVTTWTVDSSFAPGCTADTHNCQKISDAAIQAGAGDTIQVKPGTYTDSATISDNNLTLTGMGVDAGVVTVIGSIRVNAETVTVQRLIIQATGTSPALKIDPPTALSTRTTNVYSAILSGAGSGAANAAISATATVTTGSIQVNAYHVTLADKADSPPTGLSQAAGNTVNADVRQSIVLGTPAGNGTLTQSANDTDNSPAHRAALFVDPANDNYLLRVGSPAIDQGGAVRIGSESTEDVDGQTRSDPWDKGGDEFFNHAPAAPGLFVSPTSVTPGQQVTAGAFAGPQPDADRGDGVAKYRFDFGDGTGVVEQTGAAATHTYSAPGQYAVTAKTVDVPGAESAPSNTVIVTVTAPSGTGGAGGSSGGIGSLPGMGGGPSGPDLSPPFLTITTPRPGQRIKRGRRAPVLRGRTSDDTGVRTVELALKRFESRGRCRWYDARRRTFLLGRCTTPRFFRAVVNDFGWSFTFPRTVNPALGRYELRTRATDFNGRRTTAFSAAARTLVGFRIVR